MKTWSARLIRDATRFPHKLLEKRICVLFEEEKYLNAYEYGLFVSTDLCHRLSYCMHSQGFIIKDTVTPHVTHLAMISNNVHNYAALGKIKWNEKTFQGIMRRPDFISLLMRTDYDLNGFEFGIKIMPKLIGRLIDKYDLKVADVISYDHFKNCAHIKDVFIF